MDKELPIYRMVIDPDKEDSGVDYIALVDSPAIQVNWFAFDHKEQFAVNQERKILTRVLVKNSLFNNHSLAG